MFTQAVGMTVSDWPVSHVVKRSQTIDPNLALLSFITEIVVSGLILRRKAMELCSDSLTRLGIWFKTSENMWAQTLSMDQKTNAIYDD